MKAWFWRVLMWLAKGLDGCMVIAAFPFTFLILVFRAMAETAEIRMLLAIAEAKVKARRKP